MKAQKKTNKSFDHHFKELLREEYKAVEVSESFIDDTRIRLSSAIDSKFNDD